MITLTEQAATAITRMRAERGASEDQHLRVYIEAGGCSGLEYAMAFATAEEGDHQMESHGVTFLVDDRSLTKLDGSEIHFDDGLTGKGFEIRNPNAASTCGCGKSFN